MLCVSQTPLSKVKWCFSLVSKRKVVDVWAGRQVFDNRKWPFTQNAHLRITSHSAEAGVKTEHNTTGTMTDVNADYIANSADPKDIQDLTTFVSILFLLWIQNFPELGTGSVNCRQRTCETALKTNCASL